MQRNRITYSDDTHITSGATSLQNEGIGTTQDMDTETLQQMGAVKANIAHGKESLKSVTEAKYIGLQL